MPEQQQTPIRTYDGEVKVEEIISDLALALDLGRPVELRLISWTSGRPRNLGLFPASPTPMQLASQGEPTDADRAAAAHEENRFPRPRGASL